MKTNRLLRIWLFILLTCIAIQPLISQDNTTDTITQERKLSVVIKNDGTEYIGYILSQDEREILIETETIGRVIIPKHEIREIREVKDREIRKGVYVGTTSSLLDIF